MMLSRGRETTIVTTLRGSAHQRDGRLGHEVKNIVSGALLARLFNWSYIPPSPHGPRGFREVDEIIELARLVDDWPTLRMLDGTRAAWRKPGACPDGWSVAVLNETGFAGIDSLTALKEHLATRVPNDAARLCIITTQGFRLHLHHVHAWEAVGAAPHGTYAAVTRALRRAVRREGGGHGVASPDAPLDTSRRGSIGIHVRRGDRVGRGATARYPVELVRAFVGVAAQALIGTGNFKRGVDVTVYTEPSNSSELFERGCPEWMRAAPSGGARALASARRGGAAARAATCTVTTGSILHDLHGLAGSDVLGLSSSSFSVLAYYLRGRGRPALVPVRTIAQFFGAHDGADIGRNASRHAVARARGRPPPPENLLFLNAMLLDWAAAGEGTAAGAATSTREGGGEADDREAMLMFARLKDVTRRLRAVMSMKDVE